MELLTVYISKDEIIVKREDWDSLILERDHYKRMLDNERAKAVERILAADKDV